MPRLLVARAPNRWRRIPLAVLAVTAQLLLAVIVVAIRTARVVVTLAATAATYAEQALAARTGRPALQTGIAAIAAAFVAEFLTAYHQPTTR